MKVELSGNKALFEFKGVRCALSFAEGLGWRFLSLYNDSFDDFGAAQMLAKDVGETLKENLSELFCSEENGVFSLGADEHNTVLFSRSEISFLSDGKIYRTITDLDCGKDFSRVKFVLSKEERLYGTGERFNHVNQRGKRINIYSIDRWCWTHGNSYVPIPFVLSSDCSSLYFNRFEHSVFDLGHSDRNILTVKQRYAPIDLYLFKADSPSEILEKFSDLTGHAPMPKEWCFGIQVCRYHPEFSSKEGVFAMCDAMDKNRFPWDAVIIEGFGTYNKQKWPEMKEISDYVHKLGKKFMVYQQCGRFPKNYEEFGLDDSLAVRGKDGVVLDETRSMNWLDNFSNKTMRCIDLTNKKAIEKWGEIWDYLVNEIGVDGAKIDFCEQFPDKEFIKFSDGRNPMTAHHWFPVLYNILQFNRFNAKPDGGMNFSRGGGIGTQRYPFVWAGDQRREFFFLKVVIKAALSLGLSGVPFTSWDMAGYQPSFNPLDLFQEDKVFVRALEFTAFSPNIQTHGRVKRPYDFDEHIKDVYRAYSNLHQCLKPYISEQAEISCKKGIPLMRHLFLYDCNDDMCRDIEDEYMLGSDLLIAPVLSRRKKRNIYLPFGNWVSIFDGRKYSGNQWINGFDVPFEMIPVFKKEKSDSEVIESVLNDAKIFTEEIVHLSK